MDSSRAGPEGGANGATALGLQKSGASKNFYVKRHVMS